MDRNRLGVKVTLTVSPERIMSSKFIVVGVASGSYTDAADLLATNNGSSSSFLKTLCVFFLFKPTAEDDVNVVLLTLLLMKDAGLVA